MEKNICRYIAVGYAYFECFMFIINLKLILLGFISQKLGLYN